MRKLILLLFIFSGTFFVNAQKNTLDSIAKYIVGDWDWRVRSGGIAGVLQTPENTGHKEKLVFLKCDSVENFRDGQLIYKSPFRLKRGKGITSLDSMDMLLIQDMPCSISIKGDSLTIIEQVYDGFSYLYVRNNIGVSVSKKLLQRDLNVYPNPCQNLARIQTQDNSPNKIIRVYASNGLQILSMPFADGLLDISNIPKGLYFIRLTNGENTESARLLKN